jgi:hypothetical protein
VIVIVGVIVAIVCASVSRGFCDFVVVVVGFGVVIQMFFADFYTFGF